MSLSRRRFISLTACVAAGGALQLVIACRRPERDVERTAVELTSGFQDIESVDAVGVEVLKELSGDADLESLLDEIAPERGGEALQREIREQYRRGDTLRVGGWMLATTEARIYAVAALARKSGAEPSRRGG